MIESKLILDDYLHKTFLIHDKYVNVLYAGPHDANSYNRERRRIRVNVYDQQMQSLYTKVIEGMVGQEYEEGIAIDNRLHLFVTDKKDNFSYYKVDAINGTATQSAGQLFQLPSKFRSTSTGFSPDSSFCFLIFSNYKRKIRAFLQPDPWPGKKNWLLGIVMDRNMKITTNIAVDFDPEVYDIENIHFTVDNEGQLTGLAALRTNPPKGDVTHLKYSIVQFDKSGKMSTTPVQGLPPGHLYVMQVVNSNNGISFTGLLSLAEKNRWSLISGGYDLKQKKLLTLTKVDEPPCDIAAGLLHHQVVIGSFVHKDQSRTLLLERQTHQYFSSPSGQSKGENFAALSVSIFRISNTNELLWSTKIRKGQLESVDRIYTCAVCMMDERENIHVFFHDLPDNPQLEPDGKTEPTILENRRMDKTSLLGVEITPDGSLKKYTILSNDHRVQRLSPCRSINIYNKVIFSAMKWRSGGQSTFSLGVLGLN